MVTPDWCRMMAAYNAEMNRRFYAAAARLPDAVRRQEAGAFFGSLQRTLCHLVWADQVWMARLCGSPPPAVRLEDSPAMIGDFAALQDARLAADAQLEAWAEGLVPQRLEGELGWFSASAGRQMVLPVTVVVTHVFLHQNHHRGQAHALLTRFGENTGATDLPFTL